MNKTIILFMFCVLALSGCRETDYMTVYKTDNHTGVYLSSGKKYTVADALWVKDEIRESYGMATNDPVVILNVIKLDK